MNGLKEKLKKIGNALSSIANWVGSHFGAMLTIFSIVVGFLFIRQRHKTQELETDLELKDQENKIQNLKEEANEIEQEANDSLANYNELSTKYFEGRKKSVSKVRGSAKRVRQGTKRSNKAKSQKK